MSERLIRQGALAEKKQRRMEMAAHAQGIIRALKIIIQPASITPLAELRTDEAREMITELDDLRTEYLQLLGEIKEIEKELGING